MSLRQALNPSVSLIDQNHLLYGNFIGLQYVFADGLESTILANAIGILLEQFPELGGRFSAKTNSILAGSEPVALTVHKQKEPLDTILSADRRPRFIDEYKRRNVLSGRAPLSSFTLTEFENGGAILGIAISHLITDAAGYHHIVRHLGQLYSAELSGKQPPDFPYTTALDVFSYGTDQSKAETLNQVNNRGLAKPIPIRGPIGAIFKQLIIGAMDKSLSNNVPVRIQFNSDEVARLKQTVLEESGLDWISTNIALCAHFTKLISQLSYENSDKTEIQIGQLLDLRNRYFEGEEDNQSQFVGNAILIHIDKAIFADGIHHTSRGALARYFKQRQSNTDAIDVKQRLDMLTDCLRHGFTNPDLDVKHPIISLNNQSKMPIYDVRFGDETPIRIFPQDVGDNIMFFPGSAGGIEIYIRDIVNPSRQKSLLDANWQKRIFDF